MAGIVARLLSVRPFAIASAAPFARIERDVVSQLPEKLLGQLYIFSENGGQCRVRVGDGWRTMFQESLTPHERLMLRTTIEEVVKKSSALSGVESWGRRMFDREAGITFSALGEDAPQEARQTWDTDGVRRATIQKELAKRLPEWNVYIGGLTSIDVSRKNVNKARAVIWLSTHLPAPPYEMLYVGDALYEGGNDSVVIPTGIKTRMVTDPEETAVVLEEILTLCEKSGS